MRNYCRCIFTLVLIVGSQVILHGGIELSEEMLNVLCEVAVSEDFLSPEAEDFIIGTYKTGEIGKLFIEAYKDLWSKKGRRWELKEDLLKALEKLLKTKKVQYDYELKEFFNMIEQIAYSYVVNGETIDYLVDLERAEFAYCAWFLNVYEIDLEEKSFLEMILYSGLNKLFSHLGREDFVAELSYLP